MATRVPPKVVREVEGPSREDFERMLPFAAIRDEFMATQNQRVSAWIGAFKSDEERMYRQSAVHLSGLNCLRQAILRWRAAPETPTPALGVMQMSAGHLFEALLAAAMRWKGVIVASGLKVWCNWLFQPGEGHRWLDEVKPGGPRRLDLSGCLLAGTLDWLIRWDPAWANIKGPIPRELVKPGVGRLFLCDSKAVNSGAFYFADQEVKPGYGWQLAGYDYLYERQYAETYGAVDEMRLLYTDRDSGRALQVSVPRDEWRAKFLTRAHEVRAAMIAAVQDGTLPAEMPFAEGKSGELEPAWCCSGRYCGYASQRAENKHPVCPTVNTWWGNLVGGVVKSARKDAEISSAIHCAANPTNGKEG